MARKLTAMERDQIQRSCTRVFGHALRTVRERLLEIADAADPHAYPDRYGEGDLLASFERQIAELLGKEAAVFMPSGTMAQQIALRIHCDRRARNAVALHPQSHLFVSEADAFQTLHPLHGIATGDRNALFGAADLEKIAEPLGAVLLELPERNIGGALRPWDEIEAIAEFARTNGAALHMDGARLWESQPYYAKPMANIAAPFETVYVSFYKVLGAIAGAALAGSAEVIKEARQWQWRHGGRLVQQYPMIVSAQAGLRRYLPRVAKYCEKARAIAEILGTLRDVVVTPNPPPTNMMHVHVRGDLERLDGAALRVAEASKVWLTGVWRRTENPAWQMFEIHCGEGSLAIGDAEVRELYSRILDEAR